MFRKFNIISIPQKHVIIHRHYSQPPLHLTCHHPHNLYKYSSQGQIGQHQAAATALISGQRRQWQSQQW